MSMLGGNTKVLKAYGRAKTNTVNRPVALDLDAPSQASTTGKTTSSSNFNKARLGFSRLSDSDDTEDEVDHSEPAPTQLPPKVRRQQVLSEIRNRRDAKSTQGKGKSKGKSREAEDKENVVIVLDSSTPSNSPRKGQRPQILKARPRLSVQSPTRRLLQPVPSRSSAPSPLRKPITIILDSTEASEDSEPPVAPGRGKKLSKVAKRLVLSSDEAERTDEGNSIIVVESTETLPRSSRRVHKVISYVEKEEDDIYRPSRSLIVEPPPVEPPPLVLEDPNQLADEEPEEDDEEIDELESDSEVEEEPLDIFALPSRPPILRSTYATPSHLSPLLALSSSSQIFNFISFVSNPPTPFHQTTNWRKVGEASYSEVFSTNDEDGRELVVKIIPIAAHGHKANEGVEEPYKSEWEAVRREVEISQLVGSGEVAGFVEFKGMFLVQGLYPSQLLSCWDQFKKAQKPPCDDQIRPDTLPSNQIFALVILNHSGSDLETFKLRSWRDALSVFEQVMVALKESEEKWEFEHRDLHWGNILVKSADQSLNSKMDALSLSNKSTPSKIKRSSSSLQVTLIDFTLSRAKIEDRVVCDGFEDEWIFEGEGDEQFDVYRRMRDHTEGDWDKSSPITNVLWLLYLVNKLVHYKKLRSPQPPTPLPTTSYSQSPKKTAPAHPSSPRFAVVVPCRKARTLQPPRSTFHEAREYELESKAYQKLREVQEALKPFGEGVGKAKNVSKKGKTKSKKVATNSTFGSVGELCEWYNKV